MLNVIDYIPSSILEEPFYTVAIHPVYAMGQKAVEMLVVRLTDEKPEEYQELILPMEIIVRKSSAEPSQNDSA
jgi:DNA-binding LacI/PurR family transcriptional regulator